MKYRSWVLLAAFGAVAGCGAEENSADSLPTVTTHTKANITPPAPEFPSYPGAWVQQAVETGEDFTAVAALDENRAWVADATGHVYRTQDGGATWTGTGPMPFVRVSPFGPPNSAPLRLTQLLFIDELHGWGLGPHGVVSTSDGGEHWTLHFEDWHMHYPSNSSLAFISPTTGWVVTPWGETQCTSDGGKTWTPFQIAGQNSWASVIKFVDHQTGWLVRGKQLYKTIDQGQTWQSQASLGEYGALDLSAVDDTHAWVLALDAHVYRTTSGNGWNVQDIDGSERLQFVDAATGWAVGAKILHTTNGGATWSEQKTPHSGFNDFAFVNASVGWVVGDNGLILKTETGGK